MDNNLEEDILLNGEPSNTHLMSKLLEVLNHTKATSDTINDYIHSNDTRMGNVESNLDSHSNRLDTLELKIEQLSDHAASVYNSNEILKQNLLKNNLVIVGIPKDYGDDTNQIMFNIAAMLKVKLNRNDIVNSYRINNSYSGLIVVRFATMERRNEILHNKQRLPITLGDIFEVNGDTGAQQIYLNPHVTPHFGKLSTKARLAMKEKKIFSFFISTQGLMVKLTADGDATAIITLAQLDKLIEPLEVNMDTNVLDSNITATSAAPGTVSSRIKINSAHSSSSSNRTNKPGPLSAKRKKPDSISPKGGKSIQTRLKKKKQTTSPIRLHNDSVSFNNNNNKKNRK